MGCEMVNMIVVASNKIGDYRAETPNSLFQLHEIVLEDGTSHLSGQGNPPSA